MRSIQVEEFGVANASLSIPTPSSSIYSSVVYGLPHDKMANNRERVEEPAALPTSTSNEAHAGLPSRPEGALDLPPIEQFGQRGGRGRGRGGYRSNYRGGYRQDRDTYTSTGSASQAYRPRRQYDNSGIGWDGGLVDQTDEQPYGSQQQMRRGGRGSYSATYNQNASGRRPYRGGGGGGGRSRGSWPRSRNYQPRQHLEYGQQSGFGGTEQTQLAPSIQDSLSSAKATEVLANAGWENAEHERTQEFVEHLQAQPPPPPPPTVATPTSPITSVASLPDIGSLTLSPTVSIKQTDTVVDEISDAQAEVGTVAGPLDHPHKQEMQSVSTPMTVARPSSLRNILFPSDHPTLLPSPESDPCHGLESRLVPPAQLPAPILPPPSPPPPWRSSPESTAYAASASTASSPACALLSATSIRRTTVSFADATRASTDSVYGILGT